jgi:predicted transcriptional regulator
VKLNENELEVLRLLWQEAPRKPADIQAAFSWSIDNGTLRSVLVAMVEAGLLKRRMSGKAYFYSPRVRRETLLKRMVGRIADVFADGSTGKLLMELASIEKLSDQELNELRDIAQQDDSAQQDKIAQQDDSAQQDKIAQQGDIAPQNKENGNVK